MKQISKITNAQISSRGVQALADKPNATSQYGVAGLSPAGLKQWFDQLASFIAQKVNTIIDTLSADDCAEYIKVVLDNSDYESLDDVLKSFESGEFASELVKLYPSVTSNTLTTLQSVINTIASSISTLTEGLNNAVYRLDHNTLVPVESTLSETSTNTIQNKVVAKALNKQNSGSATTHTLTTRAGGIELQRVVGESHKSKNLLDVTLTSGTSSGVTYTVNADKTITLNGTAITDAYIILGAYSINANKPYKLVGCQSGGSVSTYALMAGGLGSDYGNGHTFSYPDVYQNSIFIFVANGYVCSNLIFKPMLVDATLYPNVTYNDYEPYGIHSSGSMGCVDASTLNWEYNNVGFYRYQVSISSMRSSSTINDVKVILDEYTMSDSPLSNGSTDMTIGTVGGSVFVICKSKTSVTDFKASLDGIYLAYEPSSTPSAYALAITEHNADSTQTHSVVIPLTEPLYKDNEICKQGGKWGVLKKYGSVDLGSLSWGHNESLRYFSCPISNIKANTENFVSAIYSFKGKTLSLDKNVYSTGNASGTCVFTNFDYTDVETFKSAMSGVELVYELATPTFTPFTDQKPCYELESFDGQTVITSDGLAKLSVGYGTSDVMALTIKNMNDIAILKEGE